ncbi:hypothetical protein MYP_2692 [Sporocytophaga myxococcoides]|uniref:Lipoyl-binding domain-containing protein n=2 Tax=Sporocytophaga myxococcoides TaxID=153721 RepID=A0A098LH14_9BACT|nr:hypothetical protein MYP_2692 [Sporocytophaga myxococcoides]
MVVKITHWKKKIGDHIRENEKLVSCETNKVQIELNADTDGILVFRAEKNRELIQGDIFAIVADKYVDLEEFTF